MRIGTFPNTSDLKKTFKLQAFVETGTFKGDSLVDAHEMGFDPILSVDISRQQVFKAKVRCPYATINVGSSHIELRYMIEDLNDITLFFLDAHLPEYHGIFTRNAKERYPLECEINTIKEYKKNFERDVIICDDIRMFTKDNPEAFKEFEQPKDQMCHDISVQGLIDSLRDTHFARTFPQYGHGLLVFEPLQAPPSSNGSVTTKVTLDEPLQWLLDHTKANG